MSQQSPQRRISPLALPQTKRRRKQLGQPIHWTEQDLDALSQISPADLKAAEALWQREAPGPLKPLLQAQVQEKSE